MGTNSHIAIEYREDHGLGPIWITRAVDVAESRDYLIYALITQRDREVEPVAPRKGIPADIDQATREFIEAYGPDGHSHTWLTVAEIMHIGMRVEALHRECPKDKEWVALEHVVGVLARIWGWNNVWVIIFFDN